MKTLRSLVIPISALLLIVGATPSGHAQNRATTQFVARALQALLLCFAFLVIGTGKVHARGTYELGAYYFGTYSPTYNHTLSQSALHYPGHPYPWWGGIMQYANISAGGSIDGWSARTPVPSPLSAYEFTAIRPALGWYNQDVGDILYKQINQARAHGLTYFNFYWYYRQSSTGGIVNEAINAALHHTDDSATSVPAGSFLEANDYIRNVENRNGMKFMITIYANDGNGDYQPLTRNSVIVGEYVRRWINYMKRPDYLRTRDNRPIIAFGGTVDSDPTLVRDTIALLHQTWTNQGLGATPYVVMEHDAIGQASVLVNGSTCLNNAYAGAPTPYSNVWSHAQHRTGTVNKMASWPAGGNIPCIMTDFNEKPRTRIVLGNPNPSSAELATARANIRYLSDWNEASLDAHINDVKSYLDNNYHFYNPVRGYATIYAWNEWSESIMNVEPSCQNNHWVINKIQSKFGLVTEPGSSHQYCTTCN